MVDQEKIAAVLAMIADGSSVRKSCRAAGIAPSTFLENVDGEHYARARDAQADAHFAEIAELEESCRVGKMPPDRLRAIVDSRKWRLARMRPKVYGDKSTLEHTGDGGGPLTIQIVRFGDDGGDAA